MTESEKSSSLLGPSIIFSIILLGFNVFFWDIGDAIGFAILLFSVPVWVSFLTILLASLIQPLRKRESRGFLPFGINCAAFLVVLVVPFTRWKLDLDFAWKFQERSAVINKVKSGELRSGEGIIIRLPERYQSSSKGGSIMVEQQGNATLVFFFTFRGVLDNFSGFIYVSDDDASRIHQFQGGRATVFRKLRENWYFASFT